MIDHATGLVIQDCTFSQVQTQKFCKYQEHPANRNAPLEALLKHTKTSATHDSGKRSDSPRCYPGTRLVLFEEIQWWIQDESLRNNAPCLWLLGPAGGGKTAVAQTLAERCHERGIHVLSFFLLRSSPEPEQVKAVVHTIAYQLCTATSVVAPYILQAINADPSIFEKTPKAQMEQLITRPFREAYQANPSFQSQTTILIIDGLDACGSPNEQQLLFTLFMEALSDIPLLLFVTSRPEIHIAKFLEEYSNSSKQVVLDDRLSPSADIRHFVRSSFKKRIHVREASWPPEKALDTIIERSSGQFLYASDVVEYVCSSPANGTGPLSLSDAEERLQNVMDFKMGPRADSRPHRANVIFTQLLGSVDSRFLGTVMNTLAFMGFCSGYLPVKRTTLPGHLHSPLFRTDIPWLAKTLVLPLTTVFDIFNALRSLFDVPEHPDSQQPLRVYHPSLFEFLGDESRAGDTFFMDEAAAHSRIVSCICKYFQSLAAGIMSASPEAQNEDMEFVEATICFHLPHARPTKELARCIGSLMDLQEAASTSRPRSMWTFTCDTKKALVCFLENFYKSRKGFTFRRLIARYRLTMFRFFQIVLVKTCGNNRCSCRDSLLS